MVSHDAAAADSLLTANAELQRALRVAMQENEQRIAVERRLMADAAAFKEALEYRHTCERCGGKGVYWTDVQGEAESEVCDCWINADHVLYHEQHPGAALLTELEAARKVVSALKACWDGEASGRALESALAAYDDAMKARAE